MELRTDQGQPEIVGRFRLLRVLRDRRGLRTLLCEEESPASGTALPAGKLVVKVAAAASFSSGLSRRLDRAIELLGGAKLSGVAPPLLRGDDREQRFVASAFIEGQTLRERLDQGAQGAQAIATALGLLRALAAIHARGVVHGNVRPENVVLAADGAVTLIDFGPSLLELAPEELSAAQLLYVSPEKAGALKTAVDERADLYSAGAVIFECLAGRPPFQAEAPGELLRRHLAQPPPTLRGLGLPLPRALDELVGRLLRKDPRDRYQSAAAVIPDLEELAAALAKGEAEPALVPGRHDRRTSLTAPAFVGRQQELAALLGTLAAAKKGEGALVLLEAESGAGKTRLLDELALSASLSGAAVLRAHGVDGAVPGPLDLLRPIGELDKLGQPGKPALVLLDDCQWADAPSLEILGKLRPPALRHVLVVVAFRAEEVPADHRLRALPAALHLALQPLPPPQIEALAESMAGPLPPDAMQVLLQLAGGSPSSAAAVLHGMVEEGALAPKDGGWRADPEALGRAQSSRRAAAWLVRRIERLPKDVLQLLGAGAVLGKEFGGAQAAALSGVAPDLAAAALERARGGQIVRPAAGEDRWTFAHDRLREALLQRLSADERRALHLGAAEALEKAGSASAAEVAHHFAEGGDEARALPHALASADGLRAQGALAQAEPFYRLVSRASSDPAIRAQVAEALAAILAARGELEEARGWLEGALPGAAAGEQRARLHAALAEVASRGADPAGTIAACTAGDEGLRKANGPAVAELSARLLRSRAAALVAQGEPIRGLFAARKAGKLVHRPPRPGSSDAADSLKAAAAEALALAAAGSPARALAGLDAAIAAASVAPPPEASLARGAILAQLARFADALRAARDSARLFERAGDRYRAVEASALAADCLFRMGDVSGAATASSQVHTDALALGHRGVTAVAYALWAEAAGGKVPERSGGEQGAKGALVKAAPAGAAQRPIPSVVQAAQARGDAVRLLAENRHDDAAARLEGALGLAPALSPPAAARLFAWGATAFRLAAAHSAPLLPRRRESLLRAAASSVKQGLRISRRAPGERPHLLREAGLVAAARGDEKEARTALGAALAEAEAQGQLHQKALALLARGEVGALLGWPDAAAALAAGRQALRSLHAESPLYGTSAGASLAPTSASLAERYATLQQAGRRIATALTSEEVFARVRVAAMQLLRAERCRVFTVSSNQLGELVSADASSTASGTDRATVFSRTLAARALAAGKPVVMAEEIPSAESILYSGVRSALCAPIFLRGVAVACFTAGSQQVSGLFGEEEEQLAAFIATLAGSALENAANFAELRALSRSLEERVEQRTAELSEANRSLGRSLSELGEARARLEEKIDELTATRDQLVHTEKLALAGRLAAGVAHEINNPLAFVVSNLELLHEISGAESAPPEVKRLGELVGRSLDGVRRIADLVDSFRSLAAAPSEEPRQSLQLGEVLEECLAAMPAGPGEQTFALEITPGGTALAAREDLRTGVANVLAFLRAQARSESRTNPVRAFAGAQQGRPSIRLVDPELRLTAEERARIFDPRIDVDLDRGRRMRLDLGLSLAYQLLQRNGAELTVASEANGGAIFEIAFRARPAPTASIDSTGAPG